MNNKGFTLIELLATLLLISILTTVTTVTIISVINKSKDNSYEILKKDIRIGAETYFQECENKNITGNTSDIECNISSNSLNFTIGNLLNYGYLKSGSKDSSDNKIVENPKTNKSLNDCAYIIKKVVDSNYAVTYEIIQSNGHSSECISGSDL